MLTLEPNNYFQPTAPRRRFPHRVQELLCFSKSFHFSRLCLQLVQLSKEESQVNPMSYKHNQALMFKDALVMK